MWYIFEYMWYIFEHIMQVPSPWNNEGLGRVKGDPYLLKSQTPCFLSHSPAASLQVCSAVCSDPGASCVPQLGTGSQQFLSLGESSSVPGEMWGEQQCPGTPGRHWGHPHSGVSVVASATVHYWQFLIALIDDFCILGELVPLWEWVLLVNLKEENTQLYCLWTVRICFAFVRVSAELCGWNPILFQGSGGFLMDSKRQACFVRISWSSILPNSTWPKYIVHLHLPLS